MLPIVLYVLWRICGVVADPKQSVRQVLRSRPIHVWLLWAIGLVVVLSFWEFDPAVLLYLTEPELLAGTILLMAFQARLSLRAAGSFVIRLAHRAAG